MSDLIRSEVTDGVARLVLNRPRAINALNQEMVEAASRVLQEWARDDEVNSLEIAGEGERGLCSGADVRELADAVAGDGPWMQFLQTEYGLFMMVAQFPKPTTAYMHGITMGGGIGLSGHANRRVVDSSTLMAMPETKIGWFPDAGIMYRLSRAGAVGTHVALSSAQFGGGDAIAMGLADESSDGDLPTPLHDTAPHWMDECYSSDSAIEIVQRLENHSHPEAQQAARDIRQRSPFGVTVALRALRRAQTLTPEEVIHQDLRLSESVLPVDFVEGVRALLVDKDNQPRWRYATLEEVPASHVDDVFGY